MSLSTLWATAPATATVFFGIQANAADSGLSTTASSAWLTACRSDGDVVTMKLEAGRQYDLKIEYYENEGWAYASLVWDVKRSTDPRIKAAAEGR